jgi:hypothetical protein
MGCEFESFTSLREAQTNLEEGVSIFIVVLPLGLASQRNADSQSMANATLESNQDRSFAEEGKSTSIRHPNMRARKSVSSIYSSL